MEIDMSNYVQEMWNSTPYASHTGKGGRVVAWIIGIALIAGIAAYATESYWYPYVSPYLYR
jgi:uncharacterized membrane protein YedE/YeeE